MAPTSKSDHALLYILWCFHALNRTAFWEQSTVDNVRLRMQPRMLLRYSHRDFDILSKSVRDEVAKDLSVPPWDE